MKKLFLLAIISATTLMATAQKSNAADAIYTELEGEENIMTLSFNKKMLESIDTDIEWNDQIKYLKGDVHKVKLMLIEDGKEAGSIVNKIYKRLSKLGYKRMELNEGQKKKDKVWIFSNKKGKKFSEAHFLIEDEDGSGIFMSVYGDFTVTDEK